MRLQVTAIETPYDKVSATYLMNVTVSVNKFLAFAKQILHGLTSNKN